MQKRILINFDRNDMYFTHYSYSRVISSKSRAREARTSTYHKVAIWRRTRTVTFFWLLAQVRWDVLLDCTISNFWRCLHRCESIFSFYSLCTMIIILLLWKIVRMSRDTFYNILCEIYLYNFSCILISSEIYSKCARIRDDPFENDYLFMRRKMAP